LWEKVIAREGETTLIQGVAKMFEAPKPKEMDDIVTFEENQVTINGKWTWKPVEFELFYTGGPIEFFEAINGIDERSDCCGTFIFKN